MLQPGQVLCDRYQLNHPLGQNAGRETWHATDQKTQDAVVVKLLTFSDQVRWDDLRLFEREAQVLKQLHHPRIPQYRDYFRMDDRLLWFGLVQDYIPGRSLKQLLAEGDGLTEEEIRIIASNVLNILIYLHGLSPPVLHRDIKPSNLILGNDDYIYLVDFGAVQDRAAKEGATFTVVGTYGYAPLEQFGGRATPASDLYALGATLIHLVTGIAPADLPQQDARLQFAHLTQFNPGFVRWLSKLTEPNLNNRFSSAHEALKVLQVNELAIVAPVREKPANSQIAIRKSPEQLIIRIPGQKFTKLFTFKRLGIPFTILFVLLLLFVRAGMFLWIRIFVLIAIALFLIFGFLLTSFAETVITFNSQHFEIEWKWLGICLKHQRGRIADIDHVLRTETASFYQDQAFEVTLATGVHEYAFSRLDPPLTAAECNWLADEISAWLGIERGD